MTPRQRISTPTQSQQPSAASPPTSSTESSPVSAETPSEPEQLAPESPADNALLVTESEVRPLTHDEQETLGLADASPDYRQLLDHLTIAVERYTVGLGSWDDVTLTADLARTALGPRRQI
jgi:pyruvate/2-oxoglutarate dehydrogenase complex dihydrolipoamide acyltransferase (E2) component